MKNKTVWANRLKGKTSLSFQKIGSSISADKRLYEQDIAASIVHAKMLVKQKIIGKKDNGIKLLSSEKILIILKKVKKLLFVILILKYYKILMILSSTNLNILLVLEDGGI